MTKHVPVLLPEVMRCLDVSSGETVLDATVGSGGYARAITTSLDPDGHFIGIDADKEAITATRKAIAEFSGRQCLVVENFRNLTAVLEQCEATTLDAAVFDLGFRSEQLEAGRGFSFQEEAPLVMTLAHPDELADDAVTAETVVNDWSRESLKQILAGYGNEPHAPAIAEAIVSARQASPIETTTRLADVVKCAVPAGYRRGRRHPATRTFQAIRIAVNDEIGALEAGLAAAFAALAPDGRLAVVSFHSLEDRTVKRYFADLIDDEVAETLTPDGPVTPTAAETDFNPRARSGKLRAVKKCPAD